MRSRSSATSASIRSARRAKVSSRSSWEVSSATKLSLTNAPAGADNGVVRRDAFMPLLIAGGAVAIIPPALIHFVSREQVMFSSKTHFFAVVLSSLVATVAGVALSYGGWRRGDARAVLVGTAFTVMASLLLVHGFASPGFIVEMNGVVALTGAGDAARSAASSSHSPRFRSRAALVPWRRCSGSRRR